MTEEYTSPGVYTYTVPLGVEQIRVTAEGAGGGGGGGTDGALGRSGYSGGAGGYGQAVMSVTPGESYNVYVGEGGGGGQHTSSGGSGGSGLCDGGSGGNGGSSTTINYGGGGGGGGGGGSGLERQSDNNILITADGGGGGGGAGTTNGNDVGGGGGGGGGRGGLGGLGGCDSGTEYCGSDGNDGNCSGNGGSGGDGLNYSGGISSSGSGGSSGSATFDSILDSITSNSGAGGSGGSSGEPFEDGGSGSSGYLLIEETPPAPSFSVSSFDNTSVTLDIGDTSNEDSVDVQYKESTSSSWISDQVYGSDVLPTTYDVSGLNEGVTYDFRVVVSNSVGASDSQNLETTTLPSPTNLSINTFTDTSATLTWNVQSVDEEGIRVYRSESGGSYTEISDLSPGTETFQDTGILNATEYEYYVQAYTQYTSSDSNTVTVVTDLNNPQDLQDVSDSRNRIDVTWGSDLNEGDFYIEYERLSDNTIQKSETVSYTTTESSIDGVSDGVEYEVRVRAETSETIGPFTSIQTRVFIPHTRFTDIMLDGNGNIELIWDKIDTFDGGVFELYRSESEGDLGNKIAIFSDDRRQYIDSNVNLSNEYYYTVRRVID